MRQPKRPGTLATRATIREILGVSKQRVAQLVDGDEKFPAPLDVPEARTPVWWRSDIVAYKEFREWTGEGDPPEPDAGANGFDDATRERARELASKAKS